MGHRIAELTEPERAEAGRILGRAFATEPVFITQLPDSAERLACCTALFTASLGHALRYGGAIGIRQNGGPLLGAAYWTYKPEPELSETEQAALGFTAVFSRWGEQLEPIGRAEAEALQSFEGVPQPWRYLAAIGIEPESQGQGLGSQLLTNLVAAARASGQPFALMTDRAINVPFYERAGFRTIRHEPVTDLGVPLWSMLLGS
jgi:GNAT superfamily N-acetyltransferase